MGWGGRLSPDIYGPGAACHPFQCPGFKAQGWMNPTIPQSDQGGDVEEEKPQHENIILP